MTSVWLVLEGSGIACPNDTRELIYGVFSSRENAEECIEHHVRYIHSLGWGPLVQKDGKAIDPQGNIYFQIEEQKLDFCREDTWI